MEFIAAHYLWFKALHIVAVISWMAGMLYLPRLYVYHASAAKGSELSETFKVMERRLLKFIMNPAMILTFVFGLLIIAANPAIMQQGWIHAKILLVVGMAIIHMLYAKWRKDFARDENLRPAKFYKIWNEVPTLLMIIIVILVVVKPF